MGTVGFIRVLTSFNKFTMNFFLLLKLMSTLPAFNLEQLAKSVLPTKFQVSKSAVNYFQSCCDEFLSALVFYAEGIAKGENRRTITREDILEALAKMDLDHYSPSLRVLYS